MTLLRTRIVFVAAVVLLVASACGGSPGAGMTPRTTVEPTAPGAATQPPGAGATEVSGGAATTPPGEEATEVPGDVATEAPVAGEGTGDYCLNTEEEVSAALGVAVAESVSNENAGFGGGCLYSSADGSLLYAIGVVPVTGGDPLGAALGTEGAVEISGIGERAVLVSAQGPLVFQSGDWLVSSGGTPDLEIASDPAAYRAALETLARAAAERR